MRLAIVTTLEVIVGVLAGSRTHVTIGERKFNLVVGIVLVLIALRIGWGMVW